MMMRFNKAELGTKLSGCTRAAVAVFEADEDEVAREGVRDDPKKFGRLVARHLLKQVHSNFIVGLS